MPALVRLRISLHKQCNQLSASSTCSKLQTGTRNKGAVFTVYHNGKLPRTGGGGVDFASRSLPQTKGKSDSPLGTFFFNKVQLY